MELVRQSSFMKSAVLILRKRLLMTEPKIPLLKVGRIYRVEQDDGSVKRFKIRGVAHNGNDMQFYLEGIKDGKGSQHNKTTT